jgi:hypothetical protein
VSGERQHLGEIGEGLGGWWRLERLLQSEVVDDKRRIGIACGQRLHLIEPAPAQKVDRQRVFRSGGEHAVDPGIGGILGDALHKHDADRYGAFGRFPSGDGVGDGRVGRIDWFDEREAAPMSLAHGDGVAGIVAIERPRRDQECAVNADGVHGGDHVVARHFRRAMQHGVPRPARVVALVGMHLGIDDHGI